MLLDFRNTKYDLRKTGRHSKTAQHHNPRIEIVALPSSKAVESSTRVMHTELLEFLRPSKTA